MVHVYNWVIDQNAPFDDLSLLLDYLWDAELSDYEKSPRADHIFRSLVAVANWANGGATWQPEQYVEAFRDVPEDRWRVSGMFDPPIASNADAPGEHEPSPTWHYEGIGSRFRLAGRCPTVTIIVGWDTPLNTYFAQVWDVPKEAPHHEQGELLHWVGMSREELPTVGYLEAEIAEYSSLPEGLRARLEEARVNGQNLGRR